MHRTLGAADAIAQHVRPGDRVLLGTAAGVATTLQAELVEQSDRLTDLHLLSGMQLGDYDFLGPVLDGSWTFDSWQVMPAIRAAVAEGRVGHIPMRGALVSQEIERLRPDVFLTSVSTPDAAGMVSFGASVSYSLQALDSVPKVIAQVTPQMPRVCGTTSVPLDSFAALVEADVPLPTHTSSAPAGAMGAIARHVLDMLDEETTLQIGLGSIPETVVSLLADDPPAGLRLFGMGVDAMVPVLQRLDRPGAYVGGELLGTRDLYDFAHDNPLVEQYPVSEMLWVPRLAGIDRFVSLNGAIQVDLTGQVNSEWVAGRQVSAPGGGFDFIDAATFSRGGVSIIALASTARGGSVSTIVPWLDDGAPVTVPRHATQVVVTEHGVADLRGRTLAQRAEALIAIADPVFRDGLATEAEQRLRERPRA